MSLDWSAAFAQALPYAAFLDRHATPEQRHRWDASHARVALSAEQKTLLGGFRRAMPTLVLNGAWCGDCINQCPIFDHFAHAAGGAIDLRFLDRDEAPPAIADALLINAGHRVPHVVFLSEDFQEVARYGDRTLATYRHKAATQLGPACPTGLVPPDADLLAAVIQEWLNEFERVQLLLRLSARLREKHGD